MVGLEAVPRRPVAPGERPGRMASEQAHFRHGFSIVHGRENPGSRRPGVVKPLRRFVVPDEVKSPVAAPADSPPAKAAPRRASLVTQVATLIAITVPLLGVIAAPFFLW